MQEHMLSSRSVKENRRNSRIAVLGKVMTRPPKGYVVYRVMPFFELCRLTYVVFSEVPFWEGGKSANNRTWADVAELVSRRKRLPVSPCASGICSFAGSVKPNISITLIDVFYRLFGAKGTAEDDCATRVFRSHTSLPEEVFPQIPGAGSSYL